MNLAHVINVKIVGAIEGLEHLRAFPPDVQEAVANQLSLRRIARRNPSALLARQIGEATRRVQGRPPAPLIRIRLPLTPIIPPWSDQLRSSLD